MVLHGNMTKGGQSLITIHHYAVQISIIASLQLSQKLAMKHSRIMQL